MFSTFHNITSKTFFFTNGDVSDLLERYWYLCDPNLPKSVALDCCIDNLRETQGRGTPRVHIILENDDYNFTKAPKFDLLVPSWLDPLPLLV